MSKALPWYKRSPDRWRGGTRGMTFELKGFYSECLDAMWDRQGQLPKDVEKLATALDCNPRSVRKLLPQLVASGKLIETAIGYYNRPMMLDILGAEDLPVGGEFDPTSSQIHVEVASNSTRIPSEFDLNAPKSPMISTRVLEKKKKEVETEGDARAREHAPRPTGEVISSAEMRRALNPMAASVKPTTLSWELNGSTGLRWANGKIEITDETIRAYLRADFPGVDLVAVCNRASADIGRGRKTHDAAMGIIRLWAQRAVDDGNRAKTTPGFGPKPAYTAERGYSRY